MEDKQQMSLIEEILSVENMNEAIKKVKSNKGASCWASLYIRGKIIN